MIFFVANDGTIIKSFPSPVYQGSVNANNIYLIAPFAANLTVTVAFRLPNGVISERYVMTPSNEISGVTDSKTGKTYSGWQFAMPNEITKYFGNVKAQFFFYTPQGQIVASSSTDFPVGKGVPNILPDEPSADVYAQILSQISGLQQQLNNGAYAARAIYAWNSTYTYNANEITYYPNVGEYGAFVKSNVSNNLNNSPYTADGVLNSQYWDEIVNFNNIAENYFTTLKNLAASAAQSEANAKTAAASAAQSEAETKTAAQIISDSMTGAKVYVENNTLIFTDLAQGVRVEGKTLIIEGGL